MVQEAFLYCGFVLSVTSVALDGQGGTQYQCHGCVCSLWYDIIQMLRLQVGLDTNQNTGGYPRFVEEGFNDDYFPLWLQEAGYNTYYTGKVGKPSMS